MLRQFVESNFRLSVGKARTHAVSLDAHALGKSHGNAVPLAKKLALTDGR